ncbi:sigma-70 family RNA polymerase sigma factor [Massilia rubra]|uniref:Sigma-70 family RNA polymerase sigma factor n=1 Tax=Massilia rubra TaxID=2607910 RepID=A0ABX0LJP6_9BURK|nr:sigma-70 family RNA polymerase sigma factor [Massilia rubra]NHZ35068.1 sigma-70 family RNA polymerase sigma factor [Massilia rubra]
MERIPEVSVLHRTELRLHALFLQGLDGDNVAYRAFLQATASHLRAFLRRRLGAWPDEVEDLVQESLLAIHNQRLSYDTAVPLTAWMVAIARYKLIDWLRRHARRDAMNEPLPDEDAFFSSADADAGEARRDLGKLLASLPDKQREAIVYTKLDGLSVREAAAALQMTEAAVKVAVHRGLKTLATLFKDAL